MWEWINNILSGFTPSIINVTWLSTTIDILVVYYVFYKITQWIRETKAYTLFKGVTILILVYGAAILLELITLQWIMQVTFNIGLIAIVVIFQPELRKALEQLGKGKYLAFLKVADKNTTNFSANSAEEIVKAVKIMSGVKTGALIVIEQAQAVWEQGSSGVALDSIISSQMLLSIFEHNTPMHDGAVIIRHNRIAAAACILPLTQMEIGKEFGTRHRAAVGVSEESDAIALIVSEETGRVSIALGGSLRKDLSEKQVREILLQGQANESKENSELKKKRSLRLIRRQKKNDKDH
jgi:diadenylate cyclase